MADRSPASSIIDEAFQLFNNDASSEVNKLLTNPKAREALAVSIERKNDLTETPGVGADLAGMSYEELLVNYGPEVADNQIRLRNQVADNQRVRDRDRTTGEMLSDALHSAASGFVSGVANTSGAVVSGFASMRHGGTFREGAVEMADFSKDFTQSIRDQRSETIRDRERLIGTEAHLDAQDSAAEHARQIEAGVSPLLADARQIGRDILATGERAILDPGVSGEIVSQGVGSLIPSAALAATGAGLVGGGASLLTRAELARRVATATGSAIGAGAAEAGGTYSETVNAVLDMPLENLQNSEVFQAMIAEGMSEQEARIQFAGLTGETAFVRQLPTAMAIGFISSRFNAAPIGAFAERGVVGGLRTIVGEGIEESLQGSTSQLNQNELLQELDGRTLAQGVGQQAVEGAIGGIGQAGVSATPAATLGAVSEGASIVSDAAQAAPEIARAAGDLAQNVAQPVVDAVQERAQRPDTEGQAAGVQAARDTMVEVSNAINEGNVTPELQEVVTQRDTAPAPEGVESGPFLQNVVRVAQQFSQKSFKPTDAQKTYAASQITRLKGMIETLPENVQAQARKLVNSPQMRKLQSDAKTVDLNKTQSETTPITQDIVSESVSVAKTNPANVNPTTIGKILKESGENISDSDVQIMQGASNIASLVNQHTENQVTLSKDKFVGLTKTPELSTRDKELTGADKVSRSISVAGFTDRDKTKLRSINDFAADIFQAAQSDSGTIINSDGQSVPAETLMDQFGMFVQHMNNKVSALNESFQQNDRNGRGPHVGFDSLVKGQKIVPAGHKDAAKPVFYSRSNPNSAHTARMVYNDLQTMVGVYNEIRNTFPDRFGSLPEAQATPLLEDAGGFIDETALNTEIDAQEASERAEAQAIADERRLRKDAILKKEESLIDYIEDQQPNPTVLDETEATAEVEEQNQQQQEQFDTTNNASENIAESFTEDEVNESPEQAQLEDIPAEAEVQRDGPVRTVHEIFNKTYLENPDTAPTENLSDFIEGNPSLNPDYASFVQRVVRPVIVSMNRRLAQKVTTLDGKKMSLKDHVINGTVHKGNPVQGIVNYRNTAIVDSQTGKYDQNLMELAGIAIVDWLTTETGTDPRQLDTTLEGMGLTDVQLSEDQFDAIAGGVPISRAVDTIAADILRMWNVRQNDDASIGDLAGIAENVAKEFLTVMADSKNTSFVEIVEVPTIKDGKEVTTHTIKVDGMKQIQNNIREAREDGAPNTAKEALFGERAEGFSVGSPIANVATTQNRSDVPLSTKQQESLRNQQNVAHYRDEGKYHFFEAIGEALYGAFGWRDLDGVVNPELLKSWKGKNLSIQRNFEEVDAVMRELGTNENNSPVYYAIGITKVGRYQYQGVNPQNNKLLRALVTPTWSEMDLTNQTHLDKFWIAIAQAADLMKIEKKKHDDVLNDVQTDFTKKYGVAKDLAKEWIRTGELDSAAFGREIGEVEPQVISAIYSVAELEFAQERGDITLRTSLSVELDGLTNGAANMMVNFGQGLLTQTDYKNFNRIGFFLGRLGVSINDYFSVGNRDMYEKTSSDSELNMYQGFETQLDKADPKVMKAAANVSMFFGNFARNDETGLPEMTRNTAKNPMTKVNYGSGVLGVGVGIANDTIISFYEKIQGVPDNTNLAEYFGYPSFYQDMNTLFGADLRNVKMRQGAFTFTQDQVKFFRKNIADSIGNVLTETTKSVIGDKITEVNDMMVFSTNVQNQYLQLLFAQKLNALAERRAEEGKISRTDKGAPKFAEMTKRDYMSVVKEISHLAPIFSSDDQTLAVGSFAKQLSNLVLSTNIDGKLNQKALLPAPEEIGVRSIPYLVQGTGDAAQITNFFTGEGVAKDALGIHDGIDMPFLKIDDYAQKANKGVMESWDQDVMGMMVSNFSGFLNGNPDPELLSQAFQTVKDNSKKTTVTATSSQELLTGLEKRLKENRARKAVFKRIGVSVDQMGGSSNPFVRGEEEMGLNEINYEIQKELEGRTSKTEDVKVDIQVSTASAVLGSLKLTTEQRKVVEILKPMLPETRVVIGTIDQINAFRQENFPDDGQILEGNAQYDAANGTIFLTTTKPETIIHEMVHAATYEQVLSHYNGQTNEAVTRLEALMDEFLALDVNNQAVNEAKAAILREKAQRDPASQAAAVNEFMAYALSNEGVKSTLKVNNTSTLVVISRKVIQLMRRLMGGVPATMFDNVIFNTKVLNEPPVDNGGNNNFDDGGSDGENTPEAEYETNKWIDLMKELLDEVVDDARNLRRSARPARSVAVNAQKVVDDLRQVGLLANTNARNTFRAIYVVMSSEMKMDPNTVITLAKMFQHIDENLSPEMFGTGPEANQTYSAILNSFGAYKNGDISDALSVVLALSQTSEKFRNALAQIPDPQGAAQVDGALNQFLTKVTGNLMRKLTGSIDPSNKNLLDTMNQLADSLVDLDQQREYSTLTKVTQTLDVADDYVSGKMSQLSNKVREKNEEIKASTRGKFVKVLSNSVTLGTNLLDKNNSAITAEGAKTLTHMNVPVLSLVPIREMVTELVGTDKTNQEVVALNDEVHFKISGMRQAYREDLPGILQNLFNAHPDETQWASMHRVLGQTDLTRFINPARMQQGMAMLEEAARRSQRISELEQALDATLLPYIAQDAKDKAQQLADFMNGNGAGKLLMRNAYAIVKNLDGNFEESMVEVVDELVTMYAIDQMDADVRETTVQLWQNEPKAMTGLVNYIQGLNEAEDAKPGISEQAKLNAYKGFIPNHGDKDTRVIIAKDEDANELEKRGYTKLGPYDGDVDSFYDRSYFVTTIRQGGAYSQGTMQNVQSTYRGVDINTGLTVTGETSGFLSGDGVVERIVERLNDVDYVQGDDKETLLPVFDVDGTVSGFERAINPDVYKAQMRQDENLAVMLGAWAGRHVEEMLADQYNRELVDRLDDIWQNRESGTDDLFVDLKTTDDPIYAESFKLIPQGTKNYMDGKFGGEGVMVLKSMANLSVGYREASLADMWSGKTRLPKEVQNAVVNVSQFFMGKKAMRNLAVAEQVTQGVVSSAKDIIVIRSLVVPLANTKSNVIQLATRGVPIKQIVKGFRSKLAEIEEYNKNVSKKIELEAKLRLAARDANQKRIIQAKIDAIDELNARMTIAPMIEAGAYKNLSEGITDLDVEISKGRLGDIVESLADKLPERLSNVAKVGLVSKSTKIYQVANRATQYGDFLAKSIYYDHLMGFDHRDGQFIDGLSHEEAIAKMNEEFVNFSLLPGRTRSYLETMGMTWFMAFKIRIAKIALQQLRDNPVRALAINGTLSDIGSPVQDNIVSVGAEGRLDYSTGYEMLFDAPGLNPWVNLLDG